MKKILTNRRGKCWVDRETTVIVKVPVVEPTSGVRVGISGAILAGGKSSRMGAVKALLTLNGETLVERAVTALKPVTGEPIIIANSIEKYKFLNLSIYADCFNNAGPMGGIYTALKQCNTTHCFVLACDLPFVSGELLKIIYDFGLSYDVVGVDAGRGVEPLCAVYSKQCLYSIRQHLDRRQYRITNFYPEKNVKVIYLEQLDKEFSSEILLNINTPEDLEEARIRLKTDGIYTG